MGIVWLLFALTGAIRRVAGITPDSVVRGIQIALGVMLAVEAVNMIPGEWLLGAAAVAIILVFRQSRYAPAALVLMALGLAIMFFKGQFDQVGPPGFRLPPFTSFSPEEDRRSLVLAGFSQIPLTVTNAVIATVALIKSYWPDRTITERQLSWNQGIMNLIAPFFGGMPLCHGAGGLAGQYYYGARTGGTNLIEGAIEIGLGLFLAGSILTIFTLFPPAIIGAMMFLVGLELVKFARGGQARDIAPMAATAAISLIFNMAWGFLAGLLVYYLTRAWFKRTGRSS